MKDEEGEEWRATERDESGGCWRAVKTVGTVKGEGAEIRGWKAARGRRFRGGRRRGTPNSNRIWWVAAS